MNILTSDLFSDFRLPTKRSPPTDAQIAGASRSTDPSWPEDWPGAETGPEAGPEAEPSEEGGGLGSSARSNPVEGCCGGAPLPSDTVHMIRHHRNTYRSTCDRGVASPCVTSRRCTSELGVTDADCWTPGVWVKLPCGGGRLLLQVGRQGLLLGDGLDNGGVLGIAALAADVRLAALAADVRLAAIAANVRLAALAALVDLRLAALALALAVRHAQVAHTHAGPHGQEVLRHLLHAVKGQLHLRVAPAWLAQVQGHGAEAPVVLDLQPFFPLIPRLRPVTWPSAK